MESNHRQHLHGHVHEVKLERRVLPPIIPTILRNVEQNPAAVLLLEIQSLRTMEMMMKMKLGRMR
jgi:hypothetical protein